MYVDIFFEIHSGLPREGPGDDDSTRRAYAMLEGLPGAVRCLDVGCGPGMQTLVLARQTAFPVVALDTHAPFLRELVRRAAAASLEERILPLRASMFDPGLAAASFDLIWSEGAIYNMGFEHGLGELHRLLRPGGWLAATELSWIRPDPPGEILDYWKANYPGMQAVDVNLAAARAQAYRVAGHFTLPESSWMEGYYLPIERRIAELRLKYPGSPEAARALDENQREVDLFRRYSAWYGYEFYILQKM